jgi:Biotin-requiring enzyme
MLTEILVPTIADAGLKLSIGRWFKSDGDPVTSGEPLVEIESDKATHEIRSLACCRRSWSRTAARSKPAPRSAPSASSEAESIDHHL